MRNFQKKKKKKKSIKSILKKYIKNLNKGKKYEVLVENPVNHPGMTFVTDPESKEQIILKERWKAGEIILISPGVIKGELKRFLKAKNFLEEL